MVLKFAAELAKAPDQPCPCTQKFRSRTTVGFRFVHNAADEDDFIPTAKLDEVENRPREKCDRWALSFFDSVQGAQKKFETLASREDAASRYGDSIGEIDIRESDGLVSQPGRSGHFALHPAAGVTFADRVKAYYSISSGNAA